MLGLYVGSKQSAKCDHRNLLAINKDLKSIKGLIGAHQAPALDFEAALAPANPVDVSRHGWWRTQGLAQRLQIHAWAASQRAVGKSRQLGLHFRRLKLIRQQRALRGELETRQQWRQWEMALHVGTGKLLAVQWRQWCSIGQQLTALQRLIPPDQSPARDTQLGAAQCYGFNRAIDDARRHRPVLWAVHARKKSWVDGMGAQGRQDGVHFGLHTLQVCCGHRIVHLVAVVKKKKSWFSPAFVETARPRRILRPTYSVQDLTT